MTLRPACALALLALSCSDTALPTGPEAENDDVRQVADSVAITLASGEEVPYLAVLKYSDGRELGFWTEPPSVDEEGADDGDDGNSDPILASCREQMGEREAQPSLDANTTCLDLFLANTPSDMPIPRDLVDAEDDPRRLSLESRQIMDGPIGVRHVDASHLSVAPAEADASLWCDMTDDDYARWGCFRTIWPEQDEVARCTLHTIEREIVHKTEAYRKNTLTRSTFCDTHGDLHYHWKNAFNNWKSGPTIKDLKSGSLVTYRRYRKFNRRRKTRHEAVWPEQMDILRGLTSYYQPQ